MTELQNRIIELRKKGLSLSKIISETGASKGVIGYTLSPKFIEAQRRKAAKEKADTEFEELVIKYLPESNSLNNLCSKLGLKGVNGYYKKINRIIKKNNLSTSHFGTILFEKISRNKFTSLTDEEFFVNGSSRNGKSIIKRLVDGGYKKYKCENCGVSEWDGKPLRLQVHHMNGDHYDNRVENLQLLCPNCHSQTDTYSRQNKGVENNRFIVTKRANEILENKDSSFIEDKPKENIKYIYEKKKRFCKFCGKEILGEGKKYCSHECAQKASVRFNVEPEELINDFKEIKSYRGVGKKYGVTDNAIKRRCIKLGIISEIEKYIIHR